MTELSEIMAIPCACKGLERAWQRRFKGFGPGSRTANPHISCFLVRSADFQSAFSVIATAKPTASRRSGLLAFRAEHEISGLRVASGHILTFDSAEKPPSFEKPPKTRKTSQVEKRPGLIERDSIAVVGLFWWCFQLLLFDHRGFFSRIKYSGCDPPVSLSSHLTQCGSGVPPLWLCAQAGDTAAGRRCHFSCIAISGHCIRSHGGG